MEFNNLIPNPNQVPSQPSVFRFDSYPGNNYPYPWSNNPQEPNDKFQPVAMVPNFFHPIPPTVAPAPVAPQVPTTFQFGSNLLGQMPFQTNTFGYQEQRLHLGKRKCDSPPLQPSKQHITEEKMAEHMSKLHISSETAPTVLEPEFVKNKRLYMCEEMRKLQSDQLLPAALLEQIRKPCTALVLWQPPPRLSISGSPSDGANNNVEEDNEDETVKYKSKTSTSRSLVSESIDMGSEFAGSMELDS